MHIITIPSQLYTPSINPSEVLQVYDIHIHFSQQLPSVLKFPLVYETNGDLSPATAERIETVLTSHFHDICDTDWEVLRAWLESMSKNRSEPLKPNESLVFKAIQNVLQQRLTADFCNALAQPAWHGSTNIRCSDQGGDGAGSIRRKSILRKINGRGNA